MNNIEQFFFFLREKENIPKQWKVHLLLHPQRKKKSNVPVQSDSDFPEVMASIEVSKSRHATLPFPSVSVPWKLSYAPCQHSFVYLLSLFSLLPSFSSSPSWKKKMDIEEQSSHMHSCSLAHYCTLKYADGVEGSCLSMKGHSEKALPFPQIPSFKDPLKTNPLFPITDNWTSPLSLIPHNR